MPTTTLLKGCLILELWDVPSNPPHSGVLRYLSRDIFAALPLLVFTLCLNHDDKTFGPIYQGFGTTIGAATISCLSCIFGEAQSKTYGIRIELFHFHPQSLCIKLKDIIGKLEMRRETTDRV
jgi:hypothetical protein